MNIYHFQISTKLSPFLNFQGLGQSLSWNVDASALKPVSLGKSPEILMEHRKHKVGRISILKLQGKKKKKKIARHQELGAPQYSVGDAWEVGMGVVVSITGFDLFCPGKFIMADSLPSSLAAGALKCANCGTWQIFN